MPQSLPWKGAWEQSGRPRHPQDRRKDTGRSDIIRAGGPWHDFRAILGAQKVTRSAQRRLWELFAALLPGKVGRSEVFVVLLIGIGSRKGSLSELWIFPRY